MLLKWRIFSNKLSGICIRKVLARVFMNLFATLTLNKPNCTCLSHLERHDTSRNYSISVTLPKVARGSTVLSVLWPWRGGFRRNYFASYGSITHSYQVAYLYIFIGRILIFLMRNDHRWQQYLPFSRLCKYHFLARKYRRVPTAR